MVQQIITHMCVCGSAGARPETIINPSNDDSSRSRRRLPAGTEHAPDTGSVRYLPAFMDNNNIEALQYRLQSGEIFQVTKTHPEPQRIFDGDALRRCCFCSSVDVVRDPDCAEAASESGLSRGSLRGRRHGRTTTKRKRDSSSPASSTPRSRRSARSRQVVRDSHCDSESEDSVVESGRGQTELRQIRIDQASEYYDQSFRSIKQLCCKDLLKAWIRFCHPKKQSKYPYNGGKEMSKKMSKEEHDEYGGHLSKPDYWPCDQDGRTKEVRHTEPDHLLKPERLKLLPHILRCEDNYEDGDFRLERLIKSTNNIHLAPENKKHWKPEHLERLKEIYWVRGKEMQYEKGEIDGDTLVHVHMPKPRRNTRRARKSAAKTAKPPGKRARIKPEQSNTSVRKAPVANMCTDPQIKDGTMGQNETSKPSTHRGTSPLTEQVTPEVICYEPTLCSSNATLNPQSREDRRQNSVEENWTMRPTSFRQNPAVSTNPSFPMETSYGQLGCQQNGQAAWQQVPIRARLNDTFTRSAPAHPVTPEVESVRYPAFAASSSGLAGYSGWQTEEYLNHQGTSSVYTADADANPSLLPYTCGSFGSDYSYVNPAGGPQIDSWNDESQTVLPSYYRRLDEERQQRFGAPAVGIPPYPYQHLRMDAPSAGNQEPANQSLQRTNFGIRNASSSSGTPHKFDPFSHDQRQL